MARRASANTSSSVRARDPQLQLADVLVEAAHAAPQRPRHTGARFSKNARTPSLASSVAKASESCAWR